MRRIDNGPLEHHSMSLVRNLRQFIRKVASLVVSKNKCSKTSVLRSTRPWQREKKLRCLVAYLYSVQGQRRYISQAVASKGSTLVSIEFANSTITSRFHGRVESHCVYHS